MNSPEALALARRVRQQEENASSHASAISRHDREIASMREAQGRLLGELSGLRESWNATHEAVERIERRIDWIERPSQAAHVVVAQPPPPSSGGGGMNLKLVIALVGVISTLGGGLVQLALHLAGVH